MTSKNAPLRAAGRPVRHTSPEARKKANNEAARRYRAKKKAEADARQDDPNLISSSVIDLSALAPWKKH